jgi:hypothetical protein
MRLTREEIVRNLERKEGLHFAELILVTEGEYSQQDAAWNYLDVPHLDHVHGLVTRAPTYATRDVLVNMFFQKFLGIKFPLSAAQYSARPNSATYHTVILFFVLIVESVFEKVSDTRTRVVTHYSIGAPWFLTWLLPFMKRSLRKNYHTLMEGDIPMRERRGELRSWGYGFKSDAPEFGFTDTMLISAANVLVAKASPVFPGVRLSVETDFQEGRDVMIGRSDHLGLRARRVGGEILFFPRLCPHEGAPLDRSPCTEARVKCPWHGRIISPLAKLDLSGAGPGSATTPFHEINLESGFLSIQPIRAEA